MLGLSNSSENDVTINDVYANEIISSNVCYWHEIPY